jgi:prolyl 4-hydroxylase
MNFLKILIIILTVAIVVLILAYFGGRKVYQHFTIVNDNNLGYSTNNDPYDEPFVLRRLLTPEQCDEIISKADGNLVDSEVVGGKLENVRNSRQTWISKNDPLIRPLFDKISEMFNIPVVNAEDLQVVRYQPNQYYNEHHDSCCDASVECQDFIKRGGQRILTVLIYLNNDFTGGNTYFKNLDLKIKPEPGDAVVFFPLAKGSNKCHPKALHAGMPVDSGEKWVANLWFREREFV